MLSRYKIQTEGLGCEGRVYGRTRCRSETAPAIQIINNTATKENILMKRIMWRMDKMDKCVSEPKPHDAVNINTDKGVLHKKEKKINKKEKYKSLGLPFIFICLWCTKEAWKKNECLFLFLFQCIPPPATVLLASATEPIECQEYALHASSSCTRIQTIQFNQFFFY